MAIPGLGVKAGTRDNGAEILEAESGGAAEWAGLQVTDVINAVDQLPIRSAQKLASQLFRREPASQGKLRYLFGVPLPSIRHTKAYLAAFEEELAKAKDSVALIVVMKARFPGLGMDVALDIGAKVATGEMGANHGSRRHAARPYDSLWKFSHPGGAACPGQRGSGRG
jgi:hypothetical protein